MDTTVFLAVLIAAALHAGWNATLKLDVDRRAAVLLLALVQAAIALVVLPFVPWPHSQAWLWVGVSGALHTGYKLFLIRAYATANLSQAYPIARGSAPVFVLLVSAVWLGAVLSAVDILAVLAISLGVVLMGFGGRAALRIPRTGLVAALITAGFTAAYTLVDGLGARIAGTATGFVLWMVVADAVFMLMAFAVTGFRQVVGQMKRALVPGVAAGAMSLGSYWIAVWAFTKAPIALVAALRETSILFALLIGTVWLRERPGVAQVSAALCILAGIVLMRP